MLVFEIKLEISYLKFINIFSIYKKNIFFSSLGTCDTFLSHVTTSIFLVSSISCCILKISFSLVFSLFNKISIILCFNQTRESYVHQNVYYF